MINNEDKLLINESMGETMNQYPKYQWSYFIDGDRNQQIVFRNESWDEFLEEVRKIKTALDSKKKESTGLAAKCKTCNTEMVERSGTSPKGKPWKALMCPNAEKGKPGHKPVWL